MQIKLTLFSRFYSLLNKCEESLMKDRKDFLNYDKTLIKRLRLIFYDTLIVK